VNFNTNPQSLGTAYVDAVDHAVDMTTSRREGDLRRRPWAGRSAKGQDLSSELIGITVALLVLLIGFGSVYAALLPL